MIELLTKEEADGMKLWERELVLRDRGCQAVEPKYRIVWQNPRNLDAPLTVTVPTSRWLGYVMHGNFTPDISAYIRDKKIEQQWIKDNPDKDFNWKDAGGATHPSAPTISAMTEEEAMEYLLQKDVPSYVWGDTTANIPRYYICKREMVSSNRSFRNAWRLNTELELQ